MNRLEGGAKIVQRKRTRDAARAASLAQQEAEQQLCESHWIDFLPTVPTHFPLPSPGLKGWLTPAGKQQHSDALREHAAQQAACDEEWRLLNEHEPACVIDGINAAFSDNATPSICIDAGQDAGTRYATLVVTFPHPDFIAREVWGTSGDPKSRSDRNVADVYRRMVSSVVVATTKEAFATAPACEEARIVVVRWDTRGLSNTPRLGVIYSGTFDRSVLTTDWSTTTLVLPLESCPEGRPILRVAGHRNTSSRLRRLDHVTTNWRITINTIQEGVSQQRLVTLEGSTSPSTLRDFIGDALASARAWAEKFGRTLGSNATLQLDNEDDYYRIIGLDGSLSLDEMVEQAALERAHRQSQKQRPLGQPERLVKGRAEASSRGRAESVDFATAWQTLRGLVADVSIDSGASLQDVARVEGETGTRWTPEVRMLFTQQSGGLQLVPGFELLGLDRVLEVQQLFFDAEEFVEEQDAEIPPAAADAERPAGSPADRFLPQFIPIAEDNTGAVLVVDTRDGKLNGCVSEFSTSMGGSEALWPSIGVMVGDVITALTSDESLLQGKYRPELREGLTWSRTR
ncbi:hypothetical protein [Rhodococcus sp. (in: high G+C Gram-positive bacteria)]|uniref:hypothetical protein n=1 Tax=Rhodococcus sp. TaxID=1831 RepID=UPI0038902DDB